MRIWDEVDEFLDKYRDRFKMSFGLQYTSIIDWVADFTPRRGHPNAREYGLWQGQSICRDEAIRQAMKTAQDAIDQMGNNP